MNKYFLILLIFTGLISCDKKEEVSNSIVSYPMNIGTEWIYERQSVSNYYKYDSSKTAINAENITGTLIKSDTIKSILRKWIEKDTVINDKKLSVFKTIDTLNNAILTEYKFFDSEGLKTYACSDKYIFSPSSINNNKLNVSLLNINVERKNNSFINGDIFFEETPALDIKYPLSVNSSWSYSYLIFNVYKFPTNHLTVVKNVIGIEDLILIGNKFNCFKIEFRNSNLSDDYYYDKDINWISKDGLIKSYHVSKSLEFNSNFYTEHINLLTLKKITLK